MALLNKNEADVRYLKRLRSVGAASEIGATTVPSESE
ncbi:phosphohistidine phosphatase SixA [Mycobacteroides abscessus subsp. abscessus]|nr:phosphohistidine phosphatase SixA [Mycobacteroides abscessus subsp. abscessus]